MSALAAPRLLDPLGAQESAPLELRATAALARRGARVAPELTAMDGAEAVAVLRAGGFLAAIEPAVSELAEGTVIEQEPPGGTFLGREAVVTLRLAIAPLDVACTATAIEGDVESEQAPPSAHPDDTEEWFEALSLGGLDARRGGASTGRSRAHRPSGPSAHELIIDRAPAPSLALAEPAAAVLPSERTRGPVNEWPLMTSAIFALQSSLAGVPLRRASAVALGLLLVVLLGIRLLASSDRRAQSPDHRALGPIIHAQVTARLSVRRIRAFPRRALRSRRGQGARLARPGPSHRHSRARKARAGPVTAAPTALAGPLQAAAGPSATRSPSRSGQFAYLGQ